MISVARCWPAWAGQGGSMVRDGSIPNRTYPLKSARRRRQGGCTPGQAVTLDFEGEDTL